MGRKPNNEESKGTTAGPGTAKEAAELLTSLDGIITKHKEYPERDSNKRILAAARLRITDAEGDVRNWTSRRAEVSGADTERPANFRTGRAYKSATGPTQVNDAEVKVLHWAYQQMESWKARPDVTGVLAVLSSYPTCISCQGVIASFRMAYPNVRTYTSYMGDSSYGKKVQGRHDKTTGEQTGTIRYGFKSETLTEAELSSGTVSWKHDDAVLALLATGIGFYPKKKLNEAAQELKKKKNETEYMKAVEKCMTLKVTEPLKVAFRAWHDRRVPRDPLAHRPEEAEEERGGDHPGQVVDLEVRDQALVGFHWLCRATIRARWIS